MENYQFKRLRALLEREMQSMSLEQLRIIENMAYSEQIEAQERFKEECPPVLKPNKKQPQCCSVVHCKKAPYDVFIGRPSKWGNPFTHRPDGKTLARHVVASREEAIEAYREWITNGDGKHLINDLHELKDKILGCWCKPQSCHGDVLAELVVKHCNEK